MLQWALPKLHGIETAEKYAKALSKRWPPVGLNSELLARIELIRKVVPVLTERLNAKLSEEYGSRRMFKRMRSRWKQAFYGLVDNLVYDVCLCIRVLDSNWESASPIGPAWKVEWPQVRVTPAPEPVEMYVRDGLNMQVEAAVKQALDIVNAHSVGRRYSRYMLMVRIELLADILAAATEHYDHVKVRSGVSIEAIRMRKLKLKAYNTLMMGLLDDLQSTLRLLQENLAADPHVQTGDMPSDVTPPLA